MPASFYGAQMAPRDLSISDLNWEQLEQASRLHFTAAQQSHLVKTLNAFVVERTRAEHAPPVPTVRRRLKDLGHYAQTLAMWLHDASPVGTTAMNLGFPFQQVDPTTLIQALRFLDLGTKVGLNHLSDLRANAGHPDRRSALDPLIEAWHVIYRQAGGPGSGCYKDRYSGKFRGRFLDLLDGALEQAAETVTRRDPREPRSCLPQHEQNRARQKLINMIHIPRVTLAKRIMVTLKTYT